VQTVSLKCTVIWVAFIPIAILNGLIREQYLAPLLGRQLALPFSGIICALLFFLLIWSVIPWLGPLNRARYRQIGLAWLGATVLFEFLFGRLVAEKSWGELLHNYDVTTGNLWPLVLLVIAVSPTMAARLRGLAEGRTD
jgi:hypothetical protein